MHNSAEHADVCGPQDVSGLPAAAAEVDAKLSEGFDVGEPTDTLIFVDADGVINVGIRDDPVASPLLLEDASLVTAREIPCLTSTIIEAVATRELGHGEDGTYAQFATERGSASKDICDVFVQRLAEIVQLAGPRCWLVLSSTWRRPTKSCQRRVAALEKCLSRHSGKTIGFSAHIGGLHERDDPPCRVRLIGEFVRAFTAQRATPLRVLVLEDFGATHPRDWPSEKNATKTLKEVEDFIRASSNTPDLTSVKLLHTYDEWITEHGYQVRIGSGLVLAKVCEAKRFLLGEAHTDKHCTEERLAPICLDSECEGSRGA